MGKHAADGDTITVMGAQSASEAAYTGSTPQYYGQNAKQLTSVQVMGKTVSVDEIDIDRYGRVVGLVSVGDLILNRHLIEYGYAWVYHQYCRKAVCSEWVELERQAKEGRRGLWKNPNVMAPWEYRHGGKEGKRSPKGAPGQEALSGGCCDCSGNRYNCSDFKRRADAQACYEQCLSLTGRDVHRLDGNGDWGARETTR